jgi:hypothetical protein
VWAGVDNVWEQEKLEARKMLLNRADSHTSGARFVGTLLTFEDSLPLPLGLSSTKFWRITRHFVKDFAILLLAFDNILFFFT